MPLRCPCHSGLSYATCCEPLHNGKTAINAHVLMRSRYSAYVLKIVDYLLSTWHISTRPSDLTVADLEGTKWLALRIVEADNVSAHLKHSEQDFITFKARFKQGKGKTQTMHETSRFVFEHGQWFYIDGQLHSS